MPSEEQTWIDDDWLLYFDNAIMVKKVFKDPIRLTKGLEWFLYKDTLKPLGLTIWKE